MIEDATKTEACALLNAAADLIEQHGWIRGRFGNRQDGFCALGAIEWAHMDVETKTQAYWDSRILARVELLEHANENSSCEFHSIAGWNDTRRSPKTVINAMRETAKSLCE